MKSSALFWLALVFTVTACQTNDNTADTPIKEAEKKNGVYTSKDPNTGISTKVNYRNGQKEGEALSYYASGKVWRRVNYRENRLHGAAETYDRQGRLTRSVQYQDGQLHGELAEYYKSGKKKLSVEYQNGTPLPGIYRLNVRGKETKAPEIMMERFKPAETANLYRVKFWLNEKFKDLAFYALPPDQDWLNLSRNERLQYRLPRLAGKKSEAYIDHYVEPGYFLTNDMTVYAEFEMANGNRACVKRIVHYAIENY